MGMADNYRVQTFSALLVDDEPDILELLELALRKMGLEVDRAVMCARRWPNWRRGAMTCV
jgi:DNA-binding response OmpR family regulator